MSVDKVSIEGECLVYSLFLCVLIGVLISVPGAHGSRAGGEPPRRDAPAVSHPSRYSRRSLRAFHSNQLHFESYYGRTIKLVLK